MLWASEKRGGGGGGGDDMATLEKQAMNTAQFDIFNSERCPTQTEK